MSDLRASLFTLVTNAYGSDYIPILIPLSPGTYANCRISVADFQTAIIPSDDLALAAYNLAVVGTNAAATAQSTANTAQATANAAGLAAATAQSTANSAFSIAVIGTNAAATAQSTANTAQSTADSAFELAMIGTNNGSTAYSVAESAWLLAQIGTNTGTAAYELALIASGSSSGDLALAAYNLAVVGTNAAATAQSTGDAAYALAQTGTNAAATAQSTGDAAYALAQIGTNTGTAAYELATSGSDVAWQAYLIATTGSLTLGTPTAMVGLTAVTGGGSQAMPANAAPALDQSIAPYWTGQHTFVNFGVYIGINTQAWYGPLTGGEVYVHYGTGGGARSQTVQHIDLDGNGTQYGDISTQVNSGVAYTSHTQKIGTKFFTVTRQSGDGGSGKGYVEDAIILDGVYRYLVDPAGRQGLGPAYIFDVAVALVNPVTGIVSWRSGGVEKAAVDNAGNLKVRSVSYTWPSANSTGNLTNDGSGTLTWGAQSADSAYALAQIGTNTGSTAYSVAQAAYALAQIGTNTGTAAYNLAAAAIPQSGGTCTGNLFVSNTVFGYGTQPLSNAVSGTLYYDFAGSAYQETTMSGTFRLSAKNYRPGISVTAVIVSDGTQRAIDYDTAFSWFGTQPPTTQATSGKKIVVALLSTTNGASGIMAAGAVQL